MFRGIYRGKSVHQNDSVDILKRAFDAGVYRIMLTGTSLEDSKKSIELTRSLRSAPEVPKIDFRVTVGCHPTHCNEFLADDHAHLKSLRDLIEQSRDIVSAVGEIGLDYDRLEFCPRDVQLKFFQKQVDEFHSLGLPFFLHLRGDCADDFFKILAPYDKIRGVVHSFDGSLETAQMILNKGLLIGLNGCSMRHESNIEVIKQLPLDKLMLETDAPWCDMRPTHASFAFSQMTQFHDPSWKTPDSVKKEKFRSGAMIKSRNEPALVRNVLRAIAGIHGKHENELAPIIDTNASIFFGN